MQIMLYIFEKIDHLGDDFPESVMSLLSEERKIKISKLRSPMNKNASAVAYLLLRVALINEYGINEALVFDYKEHGKPVLRNHPEIRFNLSHSGDTAACIIAGSEVGIDVQHVAGIKDKVAKKVLTDDEYSIFNKSSDPDGYFCKVWTVKESYIKKTGQGLLFDFKTIAADDIPDTHIIKGENYYCCVCGIETPIKYIGREDIEQLFTR